ncbi:hypothetical protein F889_03003 [Acinetobacter colistiniresistens]|uniref:ATP-binding protein n=1 Tax=Acinetobacter colistiniresistens TaxID=280145 RepID=N9QST4_9GAMM|nr:hypothetical protein [Acinetobacter colistiniresistens]ENX33071.1 hypothetical protein F889_03003 [Acinetobacter colistiniresistens]
MVANKTLGDVVSINRNFIKSINIELDFGRFDSIKEYIIQPSALNVLDIMANQIITTKQRTFTWTGPYGSGKSSLALILASLAGGKEDIRKQINKKINLDSITSVFYSSKPWLVTPITGSRASIEEVFLSIVKKLTNKTVLKVKKRSDLIDLYIEYIEEQNHIEGSILIVDELGKFLEYDAYQNQDIGFYQELAEKTARAKKKIVVVGILHQAFGEYARHLGLVKQQEWIKVQGRYTDLPLVSSIDENINLISKAILTNYKPENKLKVVESYIAAYNASHISKLENKAKILHECWPLHPVTVTLLSSLSRKQFGQNERSIFSFLSSYEMLGFRDVLQNLPLAEESYYSPDMLWDYLQANLESMILSSSDGHKWALNVNAVERAQSQFPSDHVKIVKAVAVIGLLKDGVNILSTQSIIETCFPQIPIHSILEILKALESASILIFRRHLNTWGIYAGSDFNIDEEVNKVLAIQGDVSISELQTLLDTVPVIASRHYWETGAMRWMNKNIVFENNLKEFRGRNDFKNKKEGSFILVLPNKYYSEKQLLNVAKKLSQEEREDNLIAVARFESQIVDLLQELKALEWLKKNKLELQSDSIALREVDARLSSLRNVLSNKFKNEFNNSIWFDHNSHKYEGNLSKLASDIADKVYAYVPVVHSEIVNRDAYSVPASKAIKDLMKAMLFFNGVENLNLDGTSASASLYKTVIKSQKIHKNEHGVWKFVIPAQEDNSSIFYLWDTTIELLRGSNRAISIEEIYNLWKLPPFGIKKGLLPIFSLAFFLTYSEKLALYHEGMFITDLDEVLVEEWIRQPKLFALRFIELNAQQHELLKLISKDFSESSDFQEKDLNPLDCAKQLVTKVFYLHPFVRKTNNLEILTKKLRIVLLAAKDPYDLLFIDIPKSFEIEDNVALSKLLKDGFNELENFWPKKLQEIETELLKSLDHFGDLHNLRVRAQSLLKIKAEPKLNIFTKRLSEYQGAQREIENLISLASKKQSKDWIDQDLDVAILQLKSWSEAFRRLETLTFEKKQSNGRYAISMSFASQDGQTVSGIVDFSKEDAEQIDTVVAKMNVQFSKGNLKKEILLAAISRIGSELLNEVKQNEEVI